MEESTLLATVQLIVRCIYIKDQQVRSFRLCLQKDLDEKLIHLLL